MKKYALGAAIVAMGIVAQGMPAFADKLDDVLARLDAIEKNNAKLAKENADLKSRLNKGESSQEHRAGCCYPRSARGQHDGYADPAALVASAGNRCAGARFS